jgi:hypothetical protein
VEGKPEPPVDVRVEWRGVPVTVLRAADRRGRQLVRLSLPGEPGRGRGALVLSISAAHDGRRHFCFDLWTEEPPRPGGGRGLAGRAQADSGQGAGRRRVEDSRVEDSP